MSDRQMLISLDVAEASDSDGFVGGVRVGDAEAYRTLEAFAGPREALERTRQLVGGVLGELLAGAEWRRVRDEHGRPPTRQDYNLAAFRSSRGPAPVTERR